MCVGASHTHTHTHGCLSFTADNYSSDAWPNDKGQGRRSADGAPLGIVLLSFGKAGDGPELSPAEVDFNPLPGLLRHAAAEI